MTPWHDAFVTVDDASFHYLRSGGAKPPLMMLHGFTDSAANCEVFARSLVDIYDVILVDTRGHGGSSPAPATYTLADQGREMVAVMHALHLSKPIVVGHSMGGATALQMALEAQDELSAVVMEDPPFRLEPLNFGVADWRTWLAEFQQRPYAEQMAEAVKEHPHWTQEENHAWLMSKTQFDLTTFDTPLLDVDIDWQQAASKMVIPGLLITGDPEMGAIVDEPTSNAMKAAWPQLSVIRISHAGHSIRRDQAAPYIEAIRNFLQTQVV